MGVQIPTGFGFSQQEFTVTGGLQPAIVTMGHNVPDNDVNAMVAQVRSAWAGALNFTTSASSVWNLGTTRCYIRLDAATLLVGENTGSTAGGGSFTNPPPVNWSILVQKRTGLAGRRHRGRMYLPPTNIAETNVGASGVIDGGTVTNLQTLMDDLMTEFTTRGYDPVLLHEDGGVPTVITEFIVQARGATQRRRMR